MVVLYSYGFIQFIQLLNHYQLLQPHGLQPTKILCPYGILQARIMEWVAISFSRGSPTPGIEPRSPALQADSYQLSYEGIPIYTTIYKIYKPVSNKVLMYGIWNYSPYLIITNNGKNLQKSIQLSVYLSIESLCCTPETQEINYS